MAIANYAKTCTTNIPGNQNLFFLEVASVATVTVTALEVAEDYIRRGGNFP